MSEQTVTQEKTRIHFILQQKGGVGKSFYTYHVANYLHTNGIGASIVDMDQDIDSTYNNCKFMNAVKFSLVNEQTGYVDRNLLRKFLEYIEEAKVKLVVCDLGAGASEQFLKYMQLEDSKEIFEIFQEDGFEYSFHCVVDSQNAFSKCASYCGNLFAAVKDLGATYIVKNLKNAFSDTHSDIVEGIAEKYNSKMINFRVMTYDDDAFLESIERVKDKGQPVSVSIDRFTKKNYAKTLVDLDEIKF